MHHPPVHTGRGGGSSGGCCGPVAILMMFVLFFFATVGGGSVDVTYQPGNGIPESTHHREKLDSSLVTPIDTYITDETGLLRDDVNIRQSMAYFYEKTGVQPYLWMTDNIDGVKNPTSSQIEKKAFAEYNRLFRDEGHLLVMLVTYTSDEYLYYMYYLPGDDAWTVFDEEAADIFMATMDECISESGWDKGLVRTFEATADEMMRIPADQTPSGNGMKYVGWIVLAVVVTGIVAVVVLAVRKKKDRALEEEEEDYEAYKQRMDGP
ncbi:MAG: hypothetical protein IJY28_04255 [Clostridia bacterium]|nr:hypothetical protein [Clostridia bacterium]